MNARMRLISTLTTPRAVFVITIILIAGTILGVTLPALFPDMHPVLLHALIWLGICCCVSQSALCSGLTIGLTGMDEVKLEAKALTGDKDAMAIHELHKTGLCLPFSLLWANVLFNVALPIMVTIAFGALPAILALIANLIFSSVIIAHFGEIFPVGIVGLNKYRIGAVLSPAIKIYMWLFRLPVLIDVWLFKKLFGEAKRERVKEKVLCKIITIYARHEPEIGQFEALGALNFFQFDDLLVNQEGEVLDERSIIAVPFANGVPMITDTHAFLQQASACDKKWVVLTNCETGQPEAVLKIRVWLRDYFMDQNAVDPVQYCHKPLVVNSPSAYLAEWVKKLKVHAEREGDDVVDNDVIIVWNHERRIITGADILGRLLRSLVEEVKARPTQQAG